MQNAQFDTKHFFSRDVNRQILRQEPKYLGGGKYSIRKRLKGRVEPEPFVNFEEVDGSDQQSMDQNLLEHGSLKPGRANETRKMLASLQSSPHIDKRNANQGANSNPKKSRLIERNRSRFKSSYNSKDIKGPLDFMRYLNDIQSS